MSARGKPDTDADEGAAPAGTGWLGRGPPMQIGPGYKQRGICDGGGPCSPGRWPPNKRALPKGGATQVIRTMMLEELGRLDAPTVPKNAACNKYTGSLFPTEATERIRRKAKEFPEDRKLRPRPPGS